MATYGTAGVPAQSTFNYDALVSTSLANYRKTLINNISSSNAILKVVMDKAYESADGGLYLAEDLMYALGSADFYSGYDVLDTNPPDGITQVQFDFRQMAAPIAISEEERKKNKHRIVDLLQSRIMQAEMGIKESFSKSMLWGSYASGGTSIVTPYTSNVNGSLGVDPIFKLVAFDPTASLMVGNIDQSAQTWWRNRTKTSAATTYEAFLAEVMNMYNTCSRGPGGPPDLILCDQTTWELLAFAYYKQYRRTDSDANFPFANLKFFNAVATWDEFMPDAYSDVTNTDTYGTMLFLNSNFIKLRYESETNFVPTDFIRPYNQDIKVKHILWMGNFTINNRRKHGVIGHIARTLT